jgi:hypothetical protein
MVSSLIEDDKLSRYVIETSKSLVASKKHSKRILIPRQRCKVLEFDLDLEDMSDLGGLTPKLRLHVALPLREFVFTLGYAIARKGQRLIADIRFNQKTNVWSESRFDADDIAYGYEESQPQNNILAILTMVEKTWSINNLTDLRFSSESSERELLNEG